MRKKIVVMLIQFIYHVIISAAIFYLLATGGKLFLKLKGNLDFSYLAIVIFGSYTGVLLNIHLGRDILASMLGAFVLSLAFTFLVLYMSSKLNDIYFSIGTLSLYMLAYQLANNLDGITGGAFGLSSMHRLLFRGEKLTSLSSFLIFTSVIVIVVLISLVYFKKSYLYQVLKARGERETVVKALGISVSRYTLLLIIVTTLLAVIGGNLYSFYYLYIDPSSFWLSMLILLLVVMFVSYKFNEIGTLIVSLVLIGGYERLRFFKVVDPEYIGYFRETIFALVIMGAAFWIFRTTNFGRSAH